MADPSDMSVDEYIESLDLPQEEFEDSPQDFFQIQKPQGNLADIVHAGALDMLFFGRTFFPKTMRQKSPKFHSKIAQALCGQHRHNAIKVFRGGAKTSLLRIFTARCVSYATHRTILYVSKSQDHAIKSVKWLKNAIDYNTQFAEMYGLSPSLDKRTGRPKKWTDEFITVWNDRYKVEISIVAVGILGQSRGLNIDDYRPDLIIADDPCDEENTATPEQRKKVSDRFWGALEKSLAPRSENSLAKLVLLQTPLDENDLIETAMRDPQFHGISFSCFDDEGNSQWPERWPTEELLLDKEGHIARNQLSLWLREMEVTVVNDESAAFKSHWLRYWDDKDGIPTGGFTMLGLDPTPPPKDWKSKPSKKHDDAVLQAWRFKRDAHGNPQAILLEEFFTKSPLPQEIVMRVFEWVLKYRPLELVMDTMVGQRTLKINIEDEMKKRAVFFPIFPYEDPRNKDARIVGNLNGPASQGTLFVHKSHSLFIDQFTKYPYVEHDDSIDCASMTIERGLQLMKFGGNIIDGDYEVLQQDDIDFDEAAP